MGDEHESLSIHLSLSILTYHFPNATFSFPKLLFTYIRLHIRGRGRKDMSHNDHVALSDYLFSTMILDFFSSIRRFICFALHTEVNTWKEIPVKRFTR